VRRGASPAFDTAPTAGDDPGMGAPARSLSGQRVLVVDDDEALRRMLRLMLEHAGCAVWSARDGRAALECVRDVAPNAILLDAQMPHLDGFGFLKAYRTLPGPHAPVALCTASPEAQERAAFVEVEAVLGKPVGLAELLAVLGALTTAGPTEPPGGSRTAAIRRAVGE
jgi:two-component system, chemotaxis family, chemotaxis protein CheY